MTIPLRAIGVFHIAAREGSITRAAASLGVTPSAVSQQIHALEVHLGASLMTKVGRRIQLTEAGERYFESITDELERVTEATNRIRGYSAVTLLTVRTAPSLATKWLLPRLATFVDANPDLEIRIDATNEPTDFNRDGVDVEVRHGEGRWSGLFVEPLIDEHYRPLCCPSLIEAGSITADQLANYRLIHSVKAQMGWPQWFATAGVEPRVRWPRILFDRSHNSVDAAVNGLGIALESDMVASSEISDGILICPVRNPPRTIVTTQWIVCPPDHLRHKKVRIFLDWLRAERAQWSKKFSWSRRRRNS
ncbi:LysR substrate-binding domain-containing protein [Leptospira interrogans]